MVFALEILEHLVLSAEDLIANVDGTFVLLLPAAFVNDIHLGVVHLVRILGGEPLVVLLVRHVVSSVRSSSARGGI